MNDFNYQLSRSDLLLFYRAIQNLLFYLEDTGAYQHNFDIVRLREILVDFDDCFKKLSCECQAVQLLFNFDYE